MLSNFKVDGHINEFENNDLKKIIIIIIKN